MMPAPRLLIALIISLAAVSGAALAGWGPAHRASATDSAPATETLTLEPGDNFIGWVASPIAVADLFAQIPEAMLIYRWDAEVRKWQAAIRDVGGNLQMLEPGMAAKIRIRGENTVEWRRPLTPAKGTVELYPGENWVAWNGYDEWTLPQAARGIGTSLESIEVEERGLVYQPDGDVSQIATSTRGEATIQRGDALRVTVDRDIRWLQPTGLMPKISFPGGATAEVQAMVKEDLQLVMDAYASLFGIQADGSSSELVVFLDLSSLLIHFESEPQIYSERSAEYARSIWEDKGTLGGAVFNGDIVILRNSWSSRQTDSRRNLEHFLLMHEYFHVVQSQLGIHGNNSRPWPGWLLEGSASWIGDVLIATNIEDGIDVSPDSILRISRERLFIEGCGGQEQVREKLLTTEEGKYFTAPFHWMGQEVGLEAPVEVFRLMSSRAKPTSWDEAFRMITGRTTEDLHDILPGWLVRAGVPATGSGEEKMLTGTIKRVDGRPVVGLQVGLVAKSPGDQLCVQHESVTDATGHFSVRGQTGREALLWLAFGEEPWNCQSTFYHEGSGVTLDAEDATRIDIDLKGGTQAIVIPNDYCVHQVSGRLVDALGTGIGDKRVTLSGDNSGYFDFRTAVDGTLAVTVPFPDRYTLSTAFDGCTIYYARDGAVGSRSRATRLDPVVGDVTGIVFQMREGLCSTKIAGRLLDAAGEAMVNTHVTANSDTGDWAGAHTDSDGAFAITIADAGSYSLSVHVDGCAVYYRRGGATAAYDQRTLISVNERDVTGIRFQLRRGQCSSKIIGRLVDSAGDPIVDAYVHAWNDDGSEDARTDASGAFSITLPSAGQYWLRARIDGCAVYHGRNGVTGRRNQATQLRVTYSDLTGVTLALSDGVCEYRISGRLVNADGSPSASQWVSAGSVMGYAGAWTTADGSFSFTVPANGSYRLSALIDDGKIYCNVYRGSRGPVKNRSGASPVRVLNADVTDIVFRLPEDPSSFCD